jgi:DNA helicase-2/ATP-dependent DNA helicase PcrA
VLEQRESGLPLRAQAVLFRTSHHSTQLELELGRRNIPFVKFGGLKFLEAAHIKDLIAALRWTENPHDRVSGFRVLLMLPGVGPRTASRVLEQMTGAMDPIDVLGGFEPPAASRDDWRALVELVRTLRQRKAAWPAQLSLARRWYEPHLFRLYDNAEARMADLAALENIAGTYPSRERFLTELTLDPPDATSDEAGVPLLDEDYLTLSTIHSAKGQEWGAVYVLNAVDGCMPSDLSTGTPAEIEEERRLLYVAMTRAKDHLHVVVPQRFYVQHQAGGGDRHVYAARTRFIPAEVALCFEARTWPLTAETQSGPEMIKPMAKIDVAARMREMWR